MIPPFTEDVRSVPMGRVLRPAYQDFERTITRQISHVEGQDDPRVLVCWLKALLSYPAEPWLGYRCKVKRDEVLGEVQALATQILYPLEQAVLEYLRAQMHERLPVIVLSEGTDQSNERLEEHVKRHLFGPAGDSPRVALLKRATRPDVLQAVVDTHIQEGIDILVCRPMHVTDLRLAYFKRVAFVSFSLNAETLYRAARCLLGPEQDEAVQTTYFVYRDTLASRLLPPLLRKLADTPSHEAKRTTVGYEEEDSLLDVARPILSEMLRRSSE